MGREYKLATTGKVPASICWMTQICAMATIAFVFYQPLSEDPYKNGLYAVICATTTVYCFSFTYSNTSLYDPDWNLFPTALGIGWVLTTPEEPSLRGLVALSLLFFWSARFTFHNVWRGYTEGLETEDWRYGDMQK
jgi:steroid 5-alpha reductase family enzyme